MTGLEAVIALDSGQTLEFGTAERIGQHQVANPTHTSSRQSATVSGIEWRTLRESRVRMWRE